MVEDCSIRFCLTRTLAIPLVKFFRKGATVCCSCLWRCACPFWTWHLSCRRELQTRLRISDNETSSIWIIGVGLTLPAMSTPSASWTDPEYFCGNPLINAVLVKCWYHLSAFKANVCGYTTYFIRSNLVRDVSFSFTLHPRRWSKNSVTRRRLADRLLAVRDGRTGGYLAVLSQTSGIPTRAGPLEQLNCRTHLTIAAMIERCVTTSEFLSSGTGGFVILASASGLLCCPVWGPDRFRLSIWFE